MPKKLLVVYKEEVKENCVICLYVAVKSLVVDI